MITKNPEPKLHKETKLPSTLQAVVSWEIISES